MSFIGVLNQFFAVANLTLTQYLLKEKKFKRINSHYTGLLEYEQNE